jgi:hypothetical protein
MNIDLFKRLAPSAHRNGRTEVKKHQNGAESLTILPTPPYTEDTLREVCIVIRGCIMQHRAPANETRSVRQVVPSLSGTGGAMIGVTTLAESRIISIS